MKTAEVMVDLGYKQKVVADEWIVTAGFLTLRLNGEPVAEYSRWVYVRWAEEKQPEYAPLGDIIAEKAQAQQ